MKTLITARKLMNTECDCLIQTDNRLIVVECKDKTTFLQEQHDRQHGLFESMELLLRRPKPLVYVEISSEPAGTRPNQWWSWAELPPVEL